MGGDFHRLDGPLPPDHEHKIRLAVLAAGELFGGAERQILTLVQELASAGGTAPILILFHDRDLADRARKAGIPVRVLGASSLVDLRSIRNLRHILCEERVDAISVHGYRASVYLALAVHSMRIRVVKTEHGNMEILGKSVAKLLRSHVYRWLENEATRRLEAHVVYVSRDLQRHCAGEHKTLARSVIYNGIGALDRASTARPPEFRFDAINLTAVGRLEAVKGLDVAIRALTHAAMPSQAYLFLVGSGPEQRRLSDLARELGVSQRVSFLGFRPNAYDYIAHADALLMPSHHEGLPYTLLESLALGTPVIASQVGGLAEVLTDRQSALLVNPGSPAALASAVRCLTETPGLRADLIRNGLDMTATSFTAGEMAHQYQSLFESIRQAEDSGIEKWDARTGA
jgi:glycosyltransferase involved in cell wall biosynthesis